jgi:hypothetical protein
LKEHFLKGTAVRRLLPVLLVALLGILLVACRGGSEASVLPIDVLRAAPDHAASEKTFKMDFDMRVRPGQGGADAMFAAMFGRFKGGGQFDLENHRHHVWLDFVFMEMEVVQDGDVCYFRSDWFGELWNRDECDDTDFLGEEQDGMSFAQPETWFDALRELADEVEDLGEATIKGVKTRHYRASVIPTFLQGPDEPDSMVVDAWIDEQGRPAQLSMEMRDDEEDLTVTITFRFFDWGEPVDIAIPSEDEISTGGFGDFFGFDDWEWDDDDEWEWPWDEDDDA